MKTEEDFADLKQVFEDGMRKQYPRHTISVSVTYDGWNLRIGYDTDTHNIETQEMSGVRAIDLAYVIFNVSLNSFMAGMKTHALVH